MNRVSVAACALLALTLPTAPLAEQKASMKRPPELARLFFTELAQTYTDDPLLPLAGNRQMPLVTARRYTAAIKKLLGDLGEAEFLPERALRVMPDTGSGPWLQLWYVTEHEGGPVAWRFAFRQFRDLWYLTEIEWTTHYLDEFLALTPLEFHRHYREATGGPSMAQEIARSARE